MTPRCHPEQQEDWGLSPADLERLIRSLSNEDLMVYTLNVYKILLSFTRLQYHNIVTQVSNSRVQHFPTLTNTEPTLQHSSQEKSTWSMLRLLNSQKLHLPHCLLKLLLLLQSKRQAKIFLKFPPKLLVKANFLDNITPCKSVLHNDPHNSPAPKPNLWRKIIARSFKGINLSEPSIKNQISQTQRQNSASYIFKAFSVCFSFPQSSLLTTTDHEHKQTWKGST